jgi:hypothetical protein
MEVTGHDQFAMLNGHYDRETYSGHQIAFVKELMAGERGADQSRVVRLGAGHHGDGSGGRIFLQSQPLYLREPETMIQRHRVQDKALSTRG